MICCYGTLTRLQLRCCIWSSDSLCGFLRFGHWLSNGNSLRHVRSSFHYLRRDPRHGNGDLFDIFDPATSFTPSHNSCFFPLIHKDFNHESGFLQALTTARLLLQSNLNSGCSSKFATLSFTSCTQLLEPGHDFVMWIGHIRLRYHAGLQRPVKLLGSSLVVSRSSCGLGVASYPQPPGRSQHGCTVGIDPDSPM